MSLVISREKFVDYVKQSEDKPDAFSEDTTYYLNLFDNYYQQEPKIVWFLEWNWPACLLGPVWLAYRGMFWVAIAVIISLEILKMVDVIAYFVGIAVLFPLLGAYGNALYLVHVEQWVTQDNQIKKGVDIPLACCVLVLFLCNTATRIITQLL